MMVRYFARTENGVVMGLREWEAVPDPLPAGIVEISADLYDAISRAGHGGTIANGAYVAPVATELRVPVDRFMDLFTDSELDAILDLIAAANKPARRMWERARLAPVNLLSPRMLTGLQYLATQGVFAPGTAAARIAAIRSNQLPA